MNQDPDLILNNKSNCSRQMCLNMFQPCLTKIVVCTRKAFRILQLCHKQAYPTSLTMDMVTRYSVVRDSLVFHGDAHDSLWAPCVGQVGEGHHE